MGVRSTVGLLPGTGADRGTGRTRRHQYRSSALSTLKLGVKSPPVGLFSDSFRPRGPGYLKGDSEGVFGEGSSVGEEGPRRLTHDGIDPGTVLRSSGVVIGTEGRKGRDA